MTMQQIARSPGSGEPHPAARTAIPSVSWRHLLNRSLESLAPAERCALGRALDAKLTRLVLADTGVVVMRVTP